MNEPLMSGSVTVIVAVIATVQIVVLTLVQALIASSKEKRDYARQDAVADRVAAAANQADRAAKLLVKAQAETIARTDEVAKLAADSDLRISDQLRAIDEQGKKIHILVNSDMTAARTNERDQTRLTLIALRRVQALSVKLGMPATDDENKAILDAEARIAELDRILADRHAAQLAVEAEAKTFGTTLQPTSAADAKTAIQKDSQ
jgi:hypothetical protein